ncbi:MAG: DUF438 domain-containing protein [Thermoprotei archaeon]
MEREKIELVKSILKEIHRGASVEELKNRFREVLAQISPFEIPIIEQQLLQEGFRVEDILKLCDLHVELFREVLEARELKGVPRGHPVELFIRENEWILKRAEVFGLYANRILTTENPEEVRTLFNALVKMGEELRKIRVHYRKVQMLIFPYLERRGINAVPRVLWGREDQVIVRLRRFRELAGKALENNDIDGMRGAAKLALEISREIGELVFRENKILYPAVYTLFSEGEWVVIDEIAGEIGWLVDVGEREWKPSAKPLYPYMVEGVVTPEQLEKLPPEFKRVVETAGIKPDEYRVKREGDLELSTGFINTEGVEGILRALPLEVTYASRDGRVRFYSTSMFYKGFVRTKTIIGRRLEYCHPPRLEGLVKKVFNEVVSGAKPYREFWTRLGNRIIRVLITPVKNSRGEILGVLETVEDLTDVVNKPEEIKSKIMVL